MPPTRADRQDPAKDSRERRGDLVQARHAIHAAQGAARLVVGQDRRRLGVVLREALADRLGVVVGPTQEIRRKVAHTEKYTRSLGYLPQEL